MSTVKIFNNACQAVLKLSKDPTDEEKLILYGYFKQATIGDINIKKPSLLYSPIDYLKNNLKWEAWKNNEGMLKEDAMIKYIKYTSDLINKYD